MRASILLLLLPLVVGVSREKFYAEVSGMECAFSMMYKGSKVERKKSKVYCRSPREDIKWSGDVTSDSGTVFTISLLVTKRSPLAKLLKASVSSLGTSGSGPTSVGGSGSGLPPVDGSGRPPPLGGPGCDRDVDAIYTGGEIVHAPPFGPLANAEECATLCAQTQGCSVWTFDNSTCTLRKTKTGKHPKNDAISGNMNCGCILQLEYRYSDGDNDVAPAIGPLKDPQACADLCAKTQEASTSTDYGSTKPCLFWSMDITRKTCVLKQSNTLIDGTGFISGNRACGSGNRRN